MKVFTFALKQTFPIFFTYVFLGIAFGILMHDAGYGVLLSVLSALFIYAGSVQLVMVPLLSSGASLLSLAAMTLLLNSRHLFYGIAFIERFRTMGWRRPYMIFSLTDETYSILCSIEYEEGLDSNQAAFLISALNQSYWVLGCFAGACAGAFLPFDLTGIDFSATAFFLVVVVGQWKQFCTKLPFAIAILVSVLCLWLFGAQQYLFPALSICTIGLILLRGPIERKEAQSHAS